MERRRRVAGERRMGMGARKRQRGACLIMFGRWREGNMKEMYLEEERYCG